jgi:hypothetical protein
MDELFSTLIQENPTGSSSQMNYNHFHDVLDEEITQEDAWVIINKYFETKGLVRQQLDSFDEFLQNSIQELIDDAGEVRIIPEDQFLSDKQVDKVTDFAAFPLLLLFSLFLFMLFPFHLSLSPLPPFFFPRAFLFSTLFSFTPHFPALTPPPAFPSWPLTVFVHR